MKHSDHRQSRASNLRRLSLGLNYCSSQRITLIFDIFRIGVVTGYREGMLNPLNLFSLKRLAHLSQFHIVLFYVLHFHVLQFHVLSFGPSFSRPAISCTANWFDNFTSVIFTAPSIKCQRRSELSTAGSMELVAQNIVLKQLQTYRRRVTLIRSESRQTSVRPCADVISCQYR